MNTINKNTPLITLLNINKEFPGVKALNNVSFELYSGEVHALVGENGAGKSTLIKILSGAYSKDSGKIIFNTKNLEKMNPHISHELGIQTIYQERNLIPYLTVAENIYISRLPKRKIGIVNWKKLNEDCGLLLKSIGVEIPPKTIVSTLSSAKQQQIEIAKALSAKSKVIIMDEPTASLARNEINQLFEIIRNLKNRGISIIYISHRLDEIFEISDRATILRDGETQGTFHSINLTKNKLISLMVGKKVDFSKRIRSRAKGELILEVKNLSRKGVLDNISFNLHKGEILGIAGMVGSGRTELARAIFGVDRIDEGKIILNDKEIKKNAPSKAKELGIGLIPEERKFDGIIPTMDVKKNITITDLKKIRAGWFLGLEKEKKIAKNYVNELRIATPNINQLVDCLSGGNQQKLVLAKWLFADVDLFIFDEPTKGIDVGAKQEIYEIIDNLAKNQKGIIVISSELEEIIHISDRVIVMNSGRIAADLTGDDICGETILSNAIGETKKIRV